MLRSISFRTHEHSRMEGVKNAAITEQESDNPGFAATIELETQTDSSLENAVAQPRRDTCAASHQPRDGCRAHVGRTCDVN